MLAFGGSFIEGNKEDTSALCHILATHGYVAESIDYRLIDLPVCCPLLTEEQITDEIFKGFSDMKSALNYMREDASNKESLDLKIIPLSHFPTF